MASKLVTNVIVSHKTIENIESCDFCEVHYAVMEESRDLYFKTSNRISETRGFLLVPPKKVKTKFVSFSSFRMEEKTNGSINSHSFCELVRLMKPNDVIAPYTLRNSVFRLTNPCQEAPEYSWDAMHIYQTLFLVWPNFEKQIDKAGLMEDRILPFCNSFIMSRRVYKIYYKQLLKCVYRSWSETKFEADWCKSFEANFSGREFGMLFERFTALWIGLNPKLTVFSNGWGVKYPDYLPNKDLDQLNWLSSSGLIPVAKLPLGQYN